MVTNPLSARARGIIYVTAIAIGAVSLVATAILNVINLEQWVSVVAAAASAAAILASSLARDNLSIETPVRMGDLEHD